jgi:hypothetical protein
MSNQARAALWFELLAISLASGCTTAGSLPGEPVDRSARLEQRRERSVTEDPAVQGTFPDGWLIPTAVSSLAEGAENAGENEVAEFSERFTGSKASKPIEATLAPGATGSIAVDIQEPAILTASAQWIGTSAALPCTLTIDQSRLGPTETLSIEPRRGGATIRTPAAVHGRAVLAVTNSSKVQIKVRFLVIATSL